MIESRSMCNGCAECRHCGRKYQKYKALICDYCHGEVEMAYVDPKTGDAFGIKVDKDAVERLQRGADKGY